MVNQWLALIGIAIAALGSWATAKLAAKAQEKRVVAEKEVSAGQLALNIAERLDKDLLTTRKELRHAEQEIEGFQIWKRKVYQVWRKHEAWDEAVMRELPAGAASRLPERPVLPD